jgi:acetolactate synthase I/II/III large subunit
MSTDLARALANGVRMHGADTVFGLPGGGPNLEVVGAVEEAGLRFVLAHGETASCIMAGTYGLLVGRPALAIATRGPGAASAANGVAQATIDRFPLLVVTDCVATTEKERVAHQRIDQVLLLGSIAKWSGRLTQSERASDDVQAALLLAGSLPAGAVHLDYDPDGEPMTAPAPIEHDRSSATDIADAATMVRRARRPVAIVGIGAIGSAVEILASLETLGCPILTTYQSIGVVPEGHSQLAGLFTGGVIESAVLNEADLVIAVGLDLVEPMPSHWRYEAPVVSVSESAASSTQIPFAVELIGPLAATLRDIVGTSTSSWPSHAGARAFAAARAALLDTSAGGFGPLELATAVASSTPLNATATVDAGAHFLSIMPFWPAHRPLRMLISNGLATMGFAVPAAIGAALARPNEPVVCMVGDGGLSMTLAELETIARLQLPITIVVFDDAALSLIEVKQKPGQGGVSAVRFNPVDFAAVASAMGIESRRVSTTAEVCSALESGWDRPRLIDARIDPTTYSKLIAATRG